MYHVEVVFLLVIKDIIVASIFYNLCTYCLFILCLLFISYIALFQGIILHNKFEKFGW